MKKIILVTFVALFILTCGTYANQINTYIELKSTIADEILDIVETRYDNYLKISELYIEKLGYDDYLKNKDSLFDSVFDYNRLKKFFTTKYTSKDVTKMFNTLNLGDIGMDFLKNRDSYIDRLREPIDNYGNYKWASYQRSPGKIDFKTITISANLQNSARLQEESASFVKAYQVRIYCPQSRSAFRGNRDFYLGTITIQYKNREDIQWKMIRKKYNKWFKRKQSISIELPGIPDLVKVKEFMGTKHEHRGKSIAQIQGIHPVLVDKKSNPLYPLILDLNALPDYSKIRSMTSSQNRKFLRSLNKINRNYYLTPGSNTNYSMNPQQVNQPYPSSLGAQVKTALEYLKSLILQKASYEKLFFEISSILQQHF